MNELERCLLPTAVIDCGNEAILEKAHSLSEGQKDVTEKAKSLFYFVRDKIRYNPYATFYPLEASSILKRRHGFCIQKAILLAALARAAGIPSRLGFATISNRQLPAKLEKIFGTNVIVWHGFAELNIDGEWIKAIPAFDLRMCRENGITPVEFDGKNHGMFHPYDQNGKPHIDYLEQHGSYDDMPLDIIVGEVIQTYGPKYFECWKTGNWDPYLDD